MILHRLSDAVSKQNWAILLIEVLVVVLGIFIGLQVEDWDQALGISHQTATGQ